MRSTITTYWVIALLLPLLSTVPPLFGIYPLHYVNVVWARIGLAYTSPSMTAGLLISMPFRPSPVRRPRFNPDAYQAYQKRL